MEEEKIKKFINGLIEFSQQNGTKSENGNLEIKISELKFNPGPVCLIGLSELDFVLFEKENNLDKSEIKSKIINFKTNGNLEFNPFIIDSYVKTLN